MRQARQIVWGLVAATLLVLGFLMLKAPKAGEVQQQTTTVASSYGGPFTLVGSDVLGGTRLRRRLLPWILPRSCAPRRFGRRRSPWCKSRRFPSP